MTKTNEGKLLRPGKSLSFTHYSRRKTFLLRLKSGMELRIRAYGWARSGNLCLFLHKECFVEIPESAIDHFSTSSKSEKRFPIIPPGPSNHNGATYSVQLPGNHLCMVICSDLECDKGVFHFLCDKIPFLTILKAGQYKLKISKVGFD